MDFIQLPLLIMNQRVAATGVSISRIVQEVVSRCFLTYN